MEDLWDFFLGGGFALVLSIDYNPVLSDADESSRFWLRLNKSTASFLHFIFCF